jgi:hypothetical protein
VIKFMTKIIFNNNNYSVDDSFLSTHSNDLQQHLSTVMNGTGAVINLGGTAYNVDSAKLATAKDAFVQHLGTIAGNGRKIVIGGVEYNVDAVKVAGAVSEIEAVLGGSISGGSGGSSGGGEVAYPEKNMYGFYFNVPYVTEANDGDYSYTMAHVFYDDGTVVTFYNDLTDDPIISTMLFANGNSGISIDYDNLADLGITFSEDGKTMIDSSYTYTAQGVEHGIYFGETYVSQDGEAIVPYASDKVVIIIGEEFNEVSFEGWKCKAHYTENYGCMLYTSIDGSVIYGGSKYEPKTYYLETSTSKLKTPSVSIVNETLTIEPVLNAKAYEVYCEDTLVTTTSLLTVDLSQYIAEKNTYLLVRAVGDEYKSSDFACVKYGAEFIAGLYKTGAVSLYEAGDYVAIEDMLVTSWGELVIDGYVIQEDTSLTKASSLLDRDLIMPNGIITIGGVAFRYCNTMTGVALPDSLTTIDEDAFYKCNMSTITIPSSVSNIGAGAFYQCKSLTNVTIPDGVTSLENSTFSGCSALTTVSLPASITYIGQEAFYYCSSLENIIYRGTAEQWGAVELYVGTYARNNWNFQVPATYVQCSDGTVSLT